uniref:Uncharacterized protein n=1 Tax=Ascaris lumbricoides TaxID=6252 RepID=A0A0M3HJN5_ASCLU
MGRVKEIGHSWSGPWYSSQSSGLTSEEEYPAQVTLRVERMIEDGLLPELCEDWTEDDEPELVIYPYFFTLFCFEYCKGRGGRWEV